MVALGQYSPLNLHYLLWLVPGLSGLRAGYAVGSDTDLLAAVAPVLGVNALSQAAVEHTLRTSDDEIDRRRRVVSRERVRVTR